jgi:hypothetical protein
MLRTSISEVSKFIELAWKQRKPVFLHGAPGIGKSSVVQQAAKAIAEREGITDFFVKDIRLSQMDPTDLGGLPIPKGENGSTAMGRIYPEWWPTKNEHGIIFFDELNKGTPSTQAAAYQLILDRRMGDRELSPNVLIVAAGNRSTDNVTVYDMDSALQNRFPMHIEVEVPSKDELTAYFESIGKNDMKIFGFWNYSERSIFRFDEKGADPSWASPRSWEFLADLLTEISDSSPKAEQLRNMKNFAVAAVGDVVGREFAAFVRLNEEVNIDEILDKPELFAQIERPDVKHSVITEIADRYKRNKNLEKKVIDFVFGTTELPEYVMLSLTMFSKANKNFVEKVVNHPKGEKLAKHMEQFI